MIRARILPAALAGLLLAAACETPLDSKERESILETADEDLLAGRLDAAERGFERVLDVDPNDARANAGVGLARLRGGRGEEALAAFDTALAGAPEDAHYIFLRARALRSLGRVDEAIEATDDTLSRDPNNAAAIIMLMDLLAEAGRVEQTAAVAREAAKQWPADPGVLLKAGQVLVSTGLPLEALECFEAVRRLRPWEPDALEGSIESLRRAGRTDDARALMPQLRELAAKAESLEALRRSAASSQGTPGPARAYIEELFAQQRFEDALRETRAFLAQFPDASTAGELKEGESTPGPGLLVQAARAAVRIGDDQGARELIRLAAAKGATSDADDLVLGEVHNALGEHEAAATAFAKYLGRTPDDVEALLGLARAQIAAGAVDAAMDPLRKVIDQTPERAEGHALMGLVLLKKSDMKGAEAALRRALEREAKNPDALLGMGLLWQQRGDLKKAEESLRAVLSARPGEPTARTVLALVLSDLDRCEEAIPLFNEALAGGHTDIGVHAGLVRCYEKTGRKEEADKARKTAEDALGQPQ